MQPGTYPITARQGSRFKLRFNISSNGIGIDLNGYTAAMQVRRSVTSSTKLLDLTSPTNITLNADSVQGDILITVSGSVMNGLPAGNWVYDIEITDGSGNTDAILEGKFLVKNQVTR